MTLRFVAIGDLHLHQGPRNEDRRAALQELIRKAGEEQIDGWLWPGDLNHARMSIEDRNFIVEAALTMVERAPLLIVPGNHDLGGELAFLKHLRGRFPIMVVERPQVVDFWPASDPRRQEPPARIFCLPYPSKGGLVGAGVAHEMLGPAAADALNVIFMQAGAELQLARTQGLLTGMIGHVNIAGALSSVGQPQIGQELEISEAHLRQLGDCFKVCNHIHKHQRVGGAIYPGSLCRLDWGETEPKGYVEIFCSKIDVTTHSDKDERFQWMHREEFVSLPVPPMYHVEGRLTRDGFDWKVKKGPNGPDDDPPRARLITKIKPISVSLFEDGEASLASDVEESTFDWSGCDVRVRAHYAAQERDVLATARERIGKMFATARRFELEMIAIPERVIRAPQVVQAQTMEEKLRAFANLSGVDWTEEIERCVERLLASEVGDEIVAEVEQRLAPLAVLAQEEESSAART